VPVTGLWGFAPANCDSERIIVLDEMVTQTPVFCMPTEHNEFEFGLMFGLLAGFVCALLLAAFVSWLGVPNGFLSTYQTLIVGVLAALGAIITVWVLWQQIRTQREEVVERHRRQLLAATATLPGTLAELSRYAGDCVTKLRKHYQSNEENAEFPSTTVEIVEVPPLPDEAIKSIKQIIENTNNDGLIEKFEVLLRQLQVQHSRLNGLNHDVSRGDRTQISWVRELILDGLIVYAHSASLFDFARKTTTLVPSTIPDATELHSAANNNALYESRFPTLHKAIDARGPLPGLASP
jgi:uncharacterized membrane protein (DUF485 family)